MRIVILAKARYSLRVRIVAVAEPRLSLRVVLIAILEFGERFQVRFPAIGEDAMAVRAAADDDVDAPAANEHFAIPTSGPLGPEAFASLRIPA
jgi:hypothetical protein